MIVSPIVDVNVPIMCKLSDKTVKHSCIDSSVGLSETESKVQPKSTFDDCFDSDYTLNPSIKKMLDESKFLFDLGNNTEFLSIKDVILKHTTKDYGQAHIPFMYHACSTYETVNKIIDRGFEPKHIVRTMYGPGFYFTGSEGEARNYGSALMTAELDGHNVCLHPKWYDAINTNSVSSRIMKFIGTDDYEISKRVLNEYVRSLMVEDLGIDFAYCFGNFVCFNPDSIQNLESMKSCRY